MKIQLLEILKLCESNLMAQIKQLKTLLHQFDHLQSDQQLKIEKSIRRLQSFCQINLQVENIQQSTKIREQIQRKQLSSTDIKNFFSQIGTDEELQHKYFENCHLVNQDSHLKSINNSGLATFTQSGQLCIGEIQNEQLHGKGIIIGENYIVDGYFYEGEFQEGLSLYFDVDDKIVCEVGANSQEREQRFDMEIKKKTQLFQQYLAKINSYIKKNASAKIIPLCINLFRQNLEQIIHQMIYQKFKSLEMIQNDNYCGFVKQQMKEGFGYYQDQSEVFYGIWKKDVFRSGMKINLKTQQALLVIEKF